MEQKRNIAEQFEYAVQQYPDNIAVRTDTVTLSYAQLNKKANALAHLIRNASIAPGSNVTLLLDHNEEIIIGLLAVLKAGKTYVPIDPYFPLERSKKIINDSGAMILIASQRQLSLAYKLLNASQREITIINISEACHAGDMNAGLAIKEDQPAYILYTSGSTGQPKGVVQMHGSVVQFIHFYISELDIKESDNVLLTTPYSHTVSVIDIFSALFAGAALTILNVKKEFDGPGFGTWLNRMQVSIIHTVPTFYRYFIKTVSDKSLLKHIRLVILGGEEVFRKDVDLYKEYFSDACLFINLYGSSEVILGTMNIVNKEYADERKIVSIGYPFDIIKAVVLDENKKEVNTHGVGELYFSAPFLQPAYYKDPQATNNLFLILDGSENEKLVKTGDLVKILPDGNIQLMGRKDTQVKINGNRVHMNEIEVNLDADEAIEQSVVVPVKNDNDEIALVAYIKVAGEKTDIEHIKETLRRKLPEYMVPSFFVKLEKIPITSNGKVDRNNLPKISYSDLKSNKEITQKTELQHTILKIWKDVFSKDNITVHDNFFQMGGNSLIGTEIVNKIMSTLGVEMELSTVFDYQSVFEIARFLEGRKVGHPV